MSDPSTRTEREAELHSWVKYVFTVSDLDKDGEIDFTELSHIDRFHRDKEDKNKDEWKDIEDEDEYTDDEFEKFKNDHSDFQ